MNRRLLAQQQTTIGRADDRARRHAVVDGDPAAVVRDGEREEMAHTLGTFLVDRAAHVLGGDRLVAGREQGVAGLRFGERRADPASGDDPQACETRNDRADDVAGPIRIEPLVDPLLGVSPREDLRID